VIARLERRDVVTVRLPGFGCPVPPGFEATKDAYAAWLVEQIARARFAPLANCSHWWPLERPDAVAVELGALWRQAESPPPR